MELIKFIISNIDAQIFIGFLAFNLIFGLMSSKGVKTIRGYSIGDKNFSTAAIASTIIATWVSGSFFITIVKESYTQGLGFIIAITLGEFITLYLAGTVFIPRMKEFLNKLSIAEAMGDLYGKHVRIVTAIAGFTGMSIGLISIQLKISGLLFEYALGIPLSYGIIIGGIIITLYSSLGGIKSVTFTDIIQFISFAIIIPVIAYFLINGVKSDHSVIKTITTNPIFDWDSTFSLSNPNKYYLLSIFIWISIPGFGPMIFQRIAMSRNIRQASQAHVAAAFICFLLAAVVCWIGILVLTIYPNVSKDDIIKTMISDYDWIYGFRGIILVGIMAMVMSTVDSCINSSSILLVYDLRKSLSSNAIKDELRATKICSMAIGLISIFFAIRSDSFLDLMLWASMFYGPVVSVPFLMTICNFRSSGKSVLIGMTAGFTTAILWEVFLKPYNVGGVLPGMLANLIFLMGSHYLLKQKGGWVKNSIESGDEIVNECNEIGTKEAFDIMKVCRKNTPKGDAFIALLGFFIMISNFLSAYAIPKEVYMNHTSLLNIIYPFTICFSAALISYSLWPMHWKETNLMPILWHVGIFTILICFSFLAVIISNFSALQLMVFMANIVVVSSLLTWRSALFLISSGLLLDLFIFKNQIVIHQLYNTSSLEFKSAYLLILISSILIICLKPKQEQIEETEAKVDGLEGEIGNLENTVGSLESEVGSLNVKITDLNETVNHYSERVQDQQQEIERLGATAQKILNNVNHELRLPVGNVVNFAEMISEGLGKLDKKNMKMLSDEVYKNSTRLSTMILNMLDLAMLDVKKIDLQKEIMNLSELVSDRVKNCRKIYLQEKQIDLEMAIEPAILVLIDPNYIRQTIDNLVINAITYSDSGTIKVSVLRKPKNMVEITIQDQGIGIPKGELYDIFTPFKMGSKTESKAQGRGVGLALCKSAVEAHGGSIAAESSGTNGALFRIVLPI